MGDERAVDAAAAPLGQRAAAPERREVAFPTKRTQPAQTTSPPASATTIVSVRVDGALAPRGFGEPARVVAPDRLLHRRDPRRGRRARSPRAASRRRAAPARRRRRRPARSRPSPRPPGTKPAARRRSARSAGRSCPCSFHSNGSPRSAKTRTCRAISVVERRALEAAEVAVLDEAAVRPVRRCARAARRARRARPAGIARHADRAARRRRRGSCGRRSRRRQRQPQRARARAGAATHGRSARARSSVASDQVSARVRVAGSRSSRAPGRSCDARRPSRRRHIAAEAHARAGGASPVGSSRYAPRRTVKCRRATRRPASRGVSG